MKLLDILEEIKQAGMLCFAAFPLVISDNDAVAVVELVLDDLCCPA